MTKKTKAIGRMASGNIKNLITEIRIVRVSETEFNKLSVDNPSDYIGLSESAKSFKKAIIAERAIIGIKPDIAAQVMYTSDDIRLKWLMTDDANYYAQEGNKCIFLLQSGHMLTMNRSSRDKVS